MVDSRRSEDVYGEKIDRCLYNSVVKFVGGVGVGIVFSVLLLKRKPWPLILGGGIGLGMGLSDCNYEFKNSSQASLTYQSQRNRSLENLVFLEKEFVVDKFERVDLPENMLSNVGKSMVMPEKYATVGDGDSEKPAMDKKAERKHKNTPFPSVSENFEKRCFRE